MTNRLYAISYSNWIEVWHVSNHAELESIIEWGSLFCYWQHWHQLLYTCTHCTPVHTVQYYWVRESILLLATLTSSPPLETLFWTCWLATNNQINFKLDPLFKIRQLSRTGHNLYPCAKTDDSVPGFKEFFYHKYLMMAVWITILILKNFHLLSNPQRGFHWMSKVLFVWYYHSY